MRVKFNKTLIAPIVLWVVLVVKLSTGYEFPNEFADMTTDAALALGSLLGHFMQPKK